MTNDMQSYKDLDAADPLRWTRDEFEIPQARACGAETDGDAVYLCGNSLGLLSKRARKDMMDELDVWSHSAVTGHFSHPLGREWKGLENKLRPHLQRIVGASHVSEVAHSSTLTSNLHNMMISFYRPTTQRWKIVIEKGAFPSDWYAVHSHPAIHSDVLSKEQIDNAVIALCPRENEFHLREEDILASIKEGGDEIALVLIPGIQYYTGQFLPVASICRATHDVGAICGVDLAHAVGNVPLALSEWDVDFAVWCTYKYLNAGPGSVGGFYVKEGLDNGGRRMAGWWGNDIDNRFEMAAEFRPSAGAQGYQHSTNPMFSSLPLLSTLEIIEKAGGIGVLYEKSKKLTSALEAGLTRSKFFLGNVDTPGKEVDISKVGFRILTPPLPERGAQLSIGFFGPQGLMPLVFAELIKRGIIGDERMPTVIRLAPTALYSNFEDVGKAIQIMEESLDVVAKLVEMRK